MHRLGLTEVPINASSNFGIREVPVHSSLIAGIHTGSAFDAILNLKMNLIIFVHGITISRANPSSTFMRTTGVTNIGIYNNVWFYF
jgi:hypothetical protein